jgi:tetratricopeptide (TPR) repeat protein
MDARYFSSLLIVVSILLFSPLAVADPWYEHYAKAEKALEDLNWTEAVDQLNQAIERKGDSGARVRTYGMKIISYFPYYKLGLAYYNLGQWDAAMQAFETEERIGAINRSDDDYVDLQRFRNLARQAKEAVEEQENRRIAEIVAGNLNRAAELEANGDLDEAMAVVGQALAVSPDDRDALAAIDRLREKVAAEQASRELVDRVTQLTEQGRSSLAAARYEEASSVFRQALSLQPSAELQSLLDDAQARLRSQLEAQNREALIRTALEEAQELEAGGNITSALDRLQPIFAVDPTNRRAADIQIRLLRTQEETERQRSRQDSIQTLVAEAQSQFDAGRYEQSLSTANRILALDPGNTDALGYIGRAYQQINRRLLGAGTGGNIPPAIRFADFREDRDDGSRVQRVDSAEFRLSGVVIDNSPVDVSFSDTQQNGLTGTSTSQTLGDFYLTEFQLIRTLEPGLSTFRLTATDSENLSSSSEYVVVYERPFFRSPWFYFASVALILSVGAAFFVGRARKRDRLLKRRFNPYVAGPPVLDENLFFGRERLIERILQTIHNNSLLLYGPTSSQEAPRKPSRSGLRLLSGLCGPAGCS